MNPAGIIVGPGGTFDLAGGLSNGGLNGSGLALSTRSYIAFGDGTKWFADPAKPAPLSSTTAADVVNFGFSPGVSPGARSISSVSLLPDGNSLTFVELMGGHVQLNGARIYPQGTDIAQSADLLIAGTDIRIVDSFLQSLYLSLVSV